MFKLSPAGKLTVLYNFEGLDSPAAGLVRSVAGKSVFSRRGFAVGEPGMAAATLPISGHDPRPAEEGPPIC